VWQGTISVGLVTVPVALYAATQDHSVSFRQIQRGTSDRIRLRRVNERTGKEVDYSDIAKGYETKDDQMVEVEPEELADIAPGRSRSLEIDTFVDVADIDPVFYDRTYWLAPNNEDYARAYHLLRQAMRDAGKAGIAMLVMHGRQHLTAVRGCDEIMVLYTMRFADEVRDPARQLPDVPSAPEPKRKELGMAAELIESMSGPWEPEQYKDTYEQKVKELVREKAAGQEPKLADEPAEPTKVIDLEEALRRSMERRGSSRRAPDIASLSKADLEKRAKELHIKGRSSMNKDELVEAIKAHSSKAAS
jgi:DNA end-binding protein Ku